jgi:DNA-binding transcriptional MerR regulator
VPPRWTLPDLVDEVAAQLAALPAPRNGQVRAVPDDRTIRYYAAIGLLDRPLEMRGRTALYGRKHLAQVVAIKRLQSMGRSLAEIQELWPTLDDATLARMSGVVLDEPAPAAPRAPFWKREPAAQGDDAPDGKPAPMSPPAPPARPGGAVELRVELAPNVTLSLALVDDRVAISPADVRALRAAAAPLLAELASRRLTSHSGGDEP